MQSEKNIKVYEILKHAFDVFLEEGFENTTFQKIADRSQITRTTLYQYFRNKLDIFHYSIRVFMDDIENEITIVCADTVPDTMQKLTKIMGVIIQKIEENRKILTVILDFVTNIHDDADELSYHIRKRTIRFRHLLSGLLIDGIRAGELREINIGAVNDMLYSLLEAAIFELSVFKRENLKHILPSYEKILLLIKK